MGIRLPDGTAPRGAGRGAFVPPTPPLTITGTPSQATVGEPYSFTPTIAGGKKPYFVAFQEQVGDTQPIPPEFSKNTSNGRISGTPASTGSFVTRLTVTDSSSPVKTAMLDVSLPVVAAAVALPGQVTNLSRGTATSSSQPLTWSAPSSGGPVASYRVERRSPAGSGPWTLVANGVVGEAFTVSGLTAQTTYEYRVTAVNATGPASSFATATGATAAAVGLVISEELWTPDMIAPRVRHDVLDLSKILKADGSQVASGDEIEVWQNVGIGLSRNTVDLTISNQTGTFTNTETITQANTGAVGTYTTRAPAGVLRVRVTSGTFSATDPVTGGASGATMTPTAVAFAPLHYRRFLASSTQIYGGAGTTATPSGHLPVSLRGGAHVMVTPEGAFSSSAARHTLFFLGEVNGNASGNDTILGMSTNNTTYFVINGAGQLISTGIPLGTPNTDPAVYRRTLATTRRLGTGTAIGSAVGYYGGSDTEIAMTSALANSSAAALALGNNGNGSNNGNPSTARVFALLLFESDIGRANLQRLEGYYAHAFGLAADDTILHPDHPYKLVPPRVPTGTTSTLGMYDANVAPASFRQVLDGFEVEIQGNAFEVGGVRMTTAVGGVPYELTTSERTRMAEKVLGYGHGFRALRWSGGLHQNRGQTADRKELLPYYTTSPEPGSTQIQADVDQYALLKTFIDASGKPIETFYEEWGCAGFWKENGNFGTSGHLAYPDPVAAPDDYATWLDGFATAYVNNMRRADNAGFKITRCRFFNEAGNIQNGGYPHVHLEGATDARVYADFVDLTITKVRAATGFINSNVSTMQFGVNSWDGPVGFGMANIKAKPNWSQITETHDHQIGLNSSDGDLLVTYTMAQRDGRPVNINEYEIFQGPYDAHLKPVGTTTSVVGAGNVPGKGADAFNFMFANNALVMVNSVSRNDATLHMLMIHLSKPTYDDNSNLGYALTEWCSTLDPVNRSGDASLSDIPQGHFRHYALNWNSTAGFLKFLPWNARRLNVENWHPAAGQGAAVFRDPSNGRLIFIIVNRTGSEWAYKGFAGYAVGGAYKTFKGYRYLYSNVPDANGDAHTEIGTIAGTHVVSTVPRYGVEFWVEQADTVAAVDNPPAPSDTTPNAFSFTDLTGQTRGAQVTGAPITITGIDAQTGFSASGGTVQKNGTGPFVASGTVVNGDTLTPRVTAPASYATAVNLVLTVGGVSDTFTVTTEAEPVQASDTTPNAFSFTPATGVARSTQIESNSVTPTGFDTATALSITGGEYALNGINTWATASISNFAPGTSVRVRHLSNAAYSTATNTVLTIGGVAATFTSTTLAEPVVTPPGATDDTATIQMLYPTNGY